MKDKETLDKIGEIVGIPKKPKENFFKNLKNYSIKDHKIKVEKKDK